MSESKHTPGPWAIHPVDDTMVARQLPDGTWEEIANTDGDYNQPETWPTMEANTRLIAAAPDLLAALQLARAYLHVSLGSPSWKCENPYPVIDAAIARATGAAQ